jgi:hypothetical protein
MALIYGFHRLADVAQTRINDQLVPLIRSAIDESMTNYNATLEAMLSLFVRRTTDFKTTFKQPTAGRLQPLDENGRARPRKHAAEYDVGLPLAAAGDAWGANYKTLIKMTVQDANDAVDQMQRNDMQWMIDYVLAALFHPTSYTYTDNDHGALTVQPIANGDTVTYLPAGGTVTATADHILAQAATIATATNPFPTIRTLLRGYRANSGQVIAFVHSNLRDEVEGLATFRERQDPNLSGLSTVETLTANITSALPPNSELIGYADGVFIAEWPDMPDNYVIATQTAGERPLAMREEPEPELQGFRFVASRNDYPFEESQFRRECGFGAWNRVGAVVVRVGNGTYAAPTGYNPTTLWG